MTINIRFGKPKLRLGIVRESWIRTPETNHFSKALPDNAHYEMVKVYGFFIGDWFFGIQRFASKLDRQREGYQFGPAPNLLDVIKDS